MKTKKELLRASELYRIANKYRAKKIHLGQEHFCQLYEQYFKAFKKEKFSLFEIGVFHGHSLRMWQEYFPNAFINGIDIREKCLFTDERIKTFLCNQNDSIGLNKLIKQIGLQRIIIDDGSHKCKDQIASFEILFPHVTPGGYYVIEDLHTAYRFTSGNPKEYNYFEGLDPVPEQSTITFLRLLIDSLHYMYYKKAATYYGDYKSKSLRTDSYSDEPITYYDRWVEFVHFYSALVIIKKREEPTE